MAIDGLSAESGALWGLFHELGVPALTSSITKKELKLQ